jgi:hypothetical protein
MVDARRRWLFYIHSLSGWHRSGRLWQLRLIRKSLGPAEEAARAATANAQAMIDNERPWIGVDTYRVPSFKKLLFA